MNYKQYLESPLWLEIRGRVLARDRFCCRSCGHRAWQVHHAQYDEATMKGRNLQHLYALCGKCHLAVTFNAYGARRPAREVAEMTAGLPVPSKPESKRKPKKRRRVPKRPKIKKERPAPKPKRSRPPKFASMRDISRSVRSIRIYDPKR